MCGDHGNTHPFPVTEKGSPPHVRGPPMYNYYVAEYDGITPACAGTTSCSSSSK